MTDPTPTQPEQTKALVLEIELPHMYVDDIPDAIAAAGLPDGGTSMGEEILGCIGEPDFGVLICEVSGEKDSSIVTTPFMVRDARIEDQAPSEPEWLNESVDWLIERAAPAELARLEAKDEADRDA